MYTTGQPLSRGIIGSRIEPLLRHSIQRQDLSGHDERTVQVVPFTDLRDGHLEVAGNECKSIATTDSVVINGLWIPLILAGSMIGSDFPCGGPAADF